MSQAVILTALPVEYLAVRSHLDNLQEIRHPQGTIYEQGHFTANGQTWDVGIAEIGAGNVRAAVEAGRAIDYFNPDILFFVGIAGGIKDVKIGDVVAATEVFCYESGKVGETFSTRPVVGQSAFAVIQRAKFEARKGEWVQRLSGGKASQPRVFVAPIVAGEKVIASRESELFQFVRDHYNDAIAVEMEGYGFLKAAFAYPGIKTIVIRGISDLIRDKNLDDPKEGCEEDRQGRAVRNASAFAFQVLAELDRVFTATIEDPIEDDNVSKGHIGVGGKISCPVPHDKKLYLMNTDKAKKKFYPQEPIRINPEDKTWWSRSRINRHGTVIVVALAGQGGQAVIENYAKVGHVEGVWHGIMQWPQDVEILAEVPVNTV